MAGKSIVTYTDKGKSRVSHFAFYLATSHDVMSFYLFEEPSSEGATAWTLIDRLDRTRLLGAGTKDTAKEWAKRLGLTNFRYVRV
jgi:hypothetical protein